MYVYALALRWVKTKDNKYALAAKAILDAYGNKLPNFSAVSGSVDQIGLEAAWVAATFAAAAEIIRHYEIDKGTTNERGAGWHPDKSYRFGKFLRKLNGYIDQYITNTIANEKSNATNWGVSCGYSKMAIGIYLDSDTIYDKGRTVLINRIPRVIQLTGEVAELCKNAKYTSGVGGDCPHPQYSLTGFAYGAEIARIQGDNSVYEANSQLIETGFNYVHNSYIIPTSPTPCIKCNDAVYVTPEGKNDYDRYSAELWPGIEIAYRYYNSTKLLALRNLYGSQTTDKYRGESHFNFLRFTSFTHYKIPLTALN